MNGFKNETTYLAFVWMTNDRLLFSQINGRSGSEIKAFITGLAAVADASHCDCMVEFLETWQNLGNVYLIDWDEISKTLSDRS